jgi:hypothetical protein
VQAVLSEGDDERAQQVRAHERSHKNRAGVVYAAERELGWVHHQPQVSTGGHRDVCACVWRSNRRGPVPRSLSIETKSATQTTEFYA